MSADSTCQWLNYGLLLLTLPVLVYSGREFYVSAWNGFAHRTANMDTLIAVGTGAAFLYSLAATVVPGFFTSRGPDARSVLRHHGHHHCPDSAGQGAGAAGQNPKPRPPSRP